MKVLASNNRREALWFSGQLATNFTKELIKTTSIVQANGHERTQSLLCADETIDYS